MESGSSAFCVIPRSTFDILSSWHVIRSSRRPLRPSSPTSPLKRCGKWRSWGLANFVSPRLPDQGILFRTNVADARGVRPGRIAARLNCPSAGSCSHDAEHYTIPQFVNVSLFFLFSPGHPTARSGVRGVPCKAQSEKKRNTTLRRREWRLIILLLGLGLSSTSLKIELVLVTP